ncbi:MAG: leucine-rich repeat protein [Firmicutes bacterium]|nr:leucine-rich repeat protein [Bacillota bacterium]
MFKKIICIGLTLFMVFSLSACVTGDIFDEGYQKGLEAGRSEGYNDGYGKGLEDGSADGYESGYEKGNSDGYEQGVDDTYKALGYGVRPADLDDPMPQIWEHEWDRPIQGEADPLKEFLVENSDLLSIDFDHASEYTLGADVLVVRPDHWENYENLENIYVEEGNPVFVSEDGVLYSKSYQTLYKWPPKKPVTQPKDCVKYFANNCYRECTMMPGDFELPDGTISIGGYAFWDSNLTELHVKQNVRTMGVYHLSIFPATIKKVTLSTPIVYANFDALYMETIIFSEGVRQIRKPTLAYSWRPRNLREVVFPQTLEAIGDIMFPFDTTVERYTIPKSVKYLDKDAFFDYGARIEGHSPPYDRDYTTVFECKTPYAQQHIESMQKEWAEWWKKMKESSPLGF